MFWCLVCLSTGALSGSLYANPLEIATQSAVACSEAKDGGLLVSWQLMECVLVWVVSSSLAMEGGFLFIMDKSLDFSVGQMWWGLLLFLSFCELICYFISCNASVYCYPLKNNSGRLSEGNTFVVNNLQKEVLLWYLHFLLMIRSFQDSVSCVFIFLCLALPVWMVIVRIATPLYTDFKKKT